MHCLYLPPQMNFFLIYQSGSCSCFTHQFFFLGLKTFYKRYSYLFVVACLPHNAGLMNGERLFHPLFIRLTGTNEHFGATANYKITLALPIAIFSYDLRHLDPGTIGTVCLNWGSVLISGGAPMCNTIKTI